MFREIMYIRYLYLYTGEIKVIDINDEDEYVSPSKNIQEVRKSFKQIKLACRKLKDEVVIPIHAGVH